MDNNNLISSNQSRPLPAAVSMPSTMPQKSQFGSMQSASGSEGAGSNSLNLLANSTSNALIPNHQGMSSLLEALLHGSNPSVSAYHDGSTPAPPGKVAMNNAGGQNSSSSNSSSNNNPMMQLALSNLLEGLQQQQQQQPIRPHHPGINPPGGSNNHMIYQQLQQLQQGAPLGGNTSNQLAQALFALRSQQQQQPITMNTTSSSGGSEKGTEQSSQYSSSTPMQSGSSSSGNGRSAPCRARGMSMEHNFQTAYFEISENVKHGDGLVCSFPDCRNRGVKFLYCAYCKDPVAKRNFRTKHTHAELHGKVPPQAGIKKVASGGTDSNDRKKAPVSTILPMSKKRKAQHLVVSSDGNGSGSGQCSGDQKESSSGAGTSSSDNPSSDLNKQKGGNLTTDENIEASRKLAKLDKERRSAWERLLVSRPDTDRSSDMSSWLMRVMAISDLNKSTEEILQEPQETTTPSGSFQQESSETSSISGGTSETSPNDDSAGEKRNSPEDRNEGDSDW